MYWLKGGGTLTYAVVIDQGPRGFMGRFRVMALTGAASYIDVRTNDPKVVRDIWDGLKAKGWTRVQPTEAEMTVRRLELLIYD
jgi:hypothetical protein